MGGPKYVEALRDGLGAGSDDVGIELVLKWSRSVEPETVELHQAVAEEKGSVWWARSSEGSGTGLATKWLELLHQQLAAGLPTHVFLYAGGEVTKTRLLEVTTDDVPLEHDLVPDYYEPGENRILWVRITEFQDVPVEVLTDGYVLAESGKPVTLGGLRNQTPLIVRPAEHPPGPSGPDVSEAFTADALSKASRGAGLMLPDAVYERLVTALRSGKHVVLTGPPGTAKTTLAMLAAELAKNAGLTTDYLMTTATADWTTYETIGGLRPTGSDTLEYASGPFVDAMREDRWLVVDELNRSNFDRRLWAVVHGAIRQPVTLPYEGPSTGERITILPPSRAHEAGPDDVVIASEWRMLATMNVFDKTLLFEMSYALMRRFAFIEVPSPQESVFGELIEREASR